MRIVGNFTVGDYLSHYKNRNDYYHRSCLERANKLLFRKVRFFLFILIFSAGASFACFGLMNAASDLKDKVENSQMLGVAALANGLPPETRDRLMEKFGGSGVDPGSIDRDTIMRYIKDARGGGR